MPIPLVNSIASWFLKKRFHQIELFLKYPNEVQNELLLDLIDEARDTEIGKQYEFASIKDYETFAQRVPVSTYEDFENLIERSRKGESNIFWPKSIRWFAKSSGTTNAKSKFIEKSSRSISSLFCLNCTKGKLKRLIALITDQKSNFFYFAAIKIW